MENQRRNRVDVKLARPKVLKAAPTPPQFNAQAFLESAGIAKTVTKYTTKTGAPLVYKYATTTTLTGTCDGKSQSVVGGTTSQFKCSHISFVRCGGSSRWSGYLDKG